MRSPSVHAASEAGGAGDEGEEELARPRHPAADAGEPQAGDGRAERRHAQPGEAHGAAPVVGGERVEGDEEGDVAGKEVARRDDPEREREADDGEGEGGPRAAHDQGEDGQAQQRPVAGQ